MRVLFKQFLGKNHSWSYVGQNIARSLIKLGHQVELFSTNGLQYFPNDLKPFLIGYMEEGNQMIFGKAPGKDYDANFSYTAMQNFPFNLAYSNKNRFGIWAWEWSGHNSLPTGFAKHHQYCDYFIAPSNYCKQIFMDSGIPENKLIVVPHGVDLNALNEAKPIDLHTNKINLCVNIGQCHMRKGIDLTLEAFGRAFTKNDNVCFVIKVSEKEPTVPFEVSFKKELTAFKKKYPNHAEIKIIKEFIPNIYSLYKACDIYFHLTRCEGFGMPFLEAMLSGISVIAPNHGGQRDFLNSENATLVNGEETFAPAKSLYYTCKGGTKWFAADVDDAAQKLKKVVECIDTKPDKVLSEQLKNYSWVKITQDICQFIK